MVIEKIGILCVLTKDTIPASGWILYPKLDKMPSSTDNDRILYVRLDKTS